MGRRISRDYSGRTLDVVGFGAFLFASDLIRETLSPVACDFVWSETREVRLAGRNYREIFFSLHRSCGAVMCWLWTRYSTGVAQDFLLNRIEEGRPRWASRFFSTSLRRAGLMFALNILALMRHLKNG